jgi:predicted nucleic acid-binding protein
LRTYVDTSFLISLYSIDANSGAALQTMSGSAGDHVISTLGELEAVNALELRVFRHEITRAQAQRSWDALAGDLRDGVFQLRPLPEQAFERAQALSRQTTARLGVRTADLLHIAAALELGADRLYTFDQQQRKLARLVRLKLN